MVKQCCETIIKRLQYPSSHGQTHHGAVLIKANNPEEPKDLSSHPGSNIGRSSIVQLPPQTQPKLSLVPRNSVTILPQTAGNFFRSTSFRSFLAASKWFLKIPPMSTLLRRRPQHHNLLQKHYESSSHLNHHFHFVQHK